MKVYSACHQDHKRGEDGVREERPEGDVVASGNAGIEVDAMVVNEVHAVVANTTMTASGWAIGPAGLAPLDGQVLAVPNADNSGHRGIQRIIRVVGSSDGARISIAGRHRWIAVKIPWKNAWVFASSDSERAKRISADQPLTHSPTESDAQTLTTCSPVPRATGMQR